MHKLFLLWAAALRLRCFGGPSVRPDGVELSVLFNELFDRSDHVSSTSAVFNDNKVKVESSAEVLSSFLNKMSPDSRRTLYSSLVPEEFEKVNKLCLTSRTKLSSHLFSHLYFVFL